MAAVEAMSTGLPAILYNVHGLRDLLQDGRGGLLVEPDENCLLEALLNISQSPELRQTYGRQAREKIIDNYSLEGSVDKLIHLYTTGGCR
jgi:glycosyltransferase involved in cell wall biosynthesis